MLLNLILSNLSISLLDVISSQDYRYIYYTHIYQKTRLSSQINVIYKFTIHQKREAANQKTSTIYTYDDI